MLFNIITFTLGNIILLIFRILKKLKKIWRRIAAIGKIG